jgi:hypothetical protein
MVASGCGLGSPDLPSAEAVAVPLASAVPSIELKAPAVQLSVGVSVPDLESSLWHQLRQQGFPIGLAEELVREKERCPVRFWIIDNSGSMLNCDGNLLKGSKKNTQIVTTTRWRELKATVEYHAELAGLLQATSLFTLINHPGDPRVPQEFSIAEYGPDSIQHEVANAKQFMQHCQPQGPSPITSSLLEVRERIFESMESLRALGQKAVVILTTDGIPDASAGDSARHSSEAAAEFVDVLMSMRDLPVWIVIRLCTDDEAVRSFYNGLDYDYELPLEVLDDYVAESSEVALHNPWLNYAMPLHRAREMGCQHRILDLLDERELTKDEVKELMVLLFGRCSGALDKAPDAHTDWKGFLKAVAPIVKQEGFLWNPQTKRLEPWINIRKLERAFRRGGSLCCLF